MTNDQHDSAFMTKHRVIHEIAILSLIVIGWRSVQNAIRWPIGSTFEHVLQPVAAIALWGWLIWRISKRPRQWGLGVGVFLVLMLLFQIFLWRRGMANPELAASRTKESVWQFTAQ